MQCKLMISLCVMFFSYDVIASDGLPRANGQKIIQNMEKFKRLVGQLNQFRDAQNSQHEFCYLIKIKKEEIAAKRRDLNQRQNSLQSLFSHPALPLQLGNQNFHPGCDNKLPRK